MGRGVRSGKEAGSRRGGRVARMVLGVACAALVSAGATAAYMNRPAGDTGSVIYPLGEMTVEQAQAMLDKQVEDSRITVSLQPEPPLKEGLLGLNFVVADDNNGWSERIEVEQSGQTVFKSGIVAPGRGIVWADAPGAQPGAAVATVYAVDGQGNDHGNPVSVEIGIKADA